MANSGYLASLFGGVESTLRRALQSAFSYVLDHGLKFGPVEHQGVSENFGAFYLSSTTHATANTEFSIVHGMGRTPYLAVPILPLNQVGAQSVALCVTRAADGARLYLSSPSTSVPITLLVE